MEQEWIFCVFPDGHTEMLRRDEIPEIEGIIKYYYDDKKSEDIKQKELKELIIDWFSRIEQMSTDRKAPTGYVMNYQDCLGEIRLIAKNSKEFVDRQFKI